MYIMWLFSRNIDLSCIYVPIAISWLCLGLLPEAWVNHEGRFDPCCSPDELRQSLGFFGNVREEGLLDIWNSKGYQDLMETYLQNDVCKQCNMRQVPG